MFGILVSTCTYSLVDYGIGETFQNSFKSVQLFGAVLSALGARKFSTQCPKWKYLPRALDARAFSFRASRTRALRTDWTSSVSHSLQTGGQHAEESKDVLSMSCISICRMLSESIKYQLPFNSAY